jgi:hypothetical protein
MSGTTGSSQDVGDKLAARPASPAAAPDRLAAGLTWFAVAAIGVALLLMIGASAVRDSWESPAIAMPGAGPPWAFSPHLSLGLVSAALWTSAILGGLGVLAGLAALARGARLPVRLLIAIGIAAVALFTVAPPTGSNDALDYAVYGRIAVLGHNPYQMTPIQLRRTGDPVGRAAPHTWSHFVTVYGPLATGEQWAAASHGGTSAARIVFWLKLWGAIAFGAVALALDRLTRGDPARRSRAHLLWTANPLLLWVLVAAGHVDVMAAAAGFLGLLAVRKHADAGGPGVLAALGAGVLVGVAADLKATYVLFGLGLAWALRRSVVALLSAAAGAALVLVPSYAGFGLTAARALLSRDGQASIGNFYQTFVGSRQVVLPHLLLIGGLAFAAVALLMLWRLPDGVPGLPAVKPALAISVAWLFFWPYQFPWYDAIALCLLALYPVSRLDWLVIIRLAVSTFAFMPGNAGFPAQHVLAVISKGSLFYGAPAVLLATAVALVWMCVSERWQMGPPAVISPLGRLRPGPARPA